MLDFSQTSFSGTRTLVPPESVNNGIPEIAGVEELLRLHEFGVNGIRIQIQCFDEQYQPSVGVLSNITDRFPDRDKHPVARRPSAQTFNVTHGKEPFGSWIVDRRYSQMLASHRWVH